MKKLKFDQFGVMTVHFVQYSWEYTLDSIAGNGFKNVDFWGGAPHYCEAMRSEKDRFAYIRKMRKAMEDRGLKMSMFTPEQMCLYPVNIAAKEDYIRERSVKTMMGYLEDTIEFGAPAMFLLAGWGYQDEPVEEAWDRSVESLHKIARRAEELGVNIVMEQLQPYESIITYNSETLCKIFEAINSPRLSGCVDCIAMAAGGETVEDYYKKFGNIVHAHLADGFPTGHLCPGDGENPLHDYLQSFANHDYKGSITMEINNEVYFQDPDASVVKARKFLENCPVVEF
ncbi:sugar phosphate isomerase/epimerase family protein [Youxingia wuxianensis]|uniref:TIM barrel protein n=1 Tax=Youxingia wuxianensis TaxID=2763678 RepID=A0A926EMP9_9FIRM|nr:sugar phosphate isomerase/epimerase family protein [Youxingia wuxianensis]MBC8585185.1 TIM barrel protein [Youxingia wuxianensis]